MLNTSTKLFVLIAALFLAASCSSGDAQNANANAVANVKPMATPSSDLTSADIAKLKWIEGTWRGKDGDTPFYERYKIVESTMIVETLKEDGSIDGEPGRFELRRGEFGKGEGDKRSAASEITDTYVQFVPAKIGSGLNSFRFEKESDGTWTALLEWPASSTKPAGRKRYRMEPWIPPSK
jgi:hypothetical protein